MLISIFTLYLHPRPREITSDKCLRCTDENGIELRASDQRPFYSTQCSLFEFDSGETN